MGWARALLLGDIGNRLDIEDAERAIRRMRGDLARSFKTNVTQDEQIRRLTADNAELKLYLASLVRLLMNNGTVSRDDLVAIVNAVDAEDGTMDGRTAGKIIE